MSSLEIVAAQRDALAAKNRELSQALERANAELARLKAPSVVSTPEVPEVPVASAPPKLNKRFSLGGIR